MTDIFDNGFLIKGLKQNRVGFVAEYMGNNLTAEQETHATSIIIQEARKQ